MKEGSALLAGDGFGVQRCQHPYSLTRAFDTWVSKRRVSDTPQRQVSVIPQQCNRQPGTLGA
jgi:hypothetical protein